MKSARRLLIAILCLTAPAACGAALSYTEGYRYLEAGLETFESTDPFGGLDRAVAGFDSLASQRSLPAATAIIVSSRISGTTERAAAFFKISFNLDAPSAWSLTGSFELLGSAGLACVSFQDLAHRDTLIVNEIIYAPPLISETRILQFGGVLPAGSYTLEAMIYGGGDNLFTRGGIDAVFRIPEPRVQGLLLIALPFGFRRRQ